MNVVKTFDRTADRAQDLIFELVRHKADALLSLDLIEWERARVAQGPRPEVDDLVNYLRVTFMVKLNYLPMTIREAVHFASCSHIHTKLRGVLVDDCRKVNVLALDSMRQDLDHLIAFAEECAVPQLPLCFTPMQQVRSGDTPPLAARLPLSRRSPPNTEHPTPNTQPSTPNG